ncbi:MAG: TonB-dependent receptor plug domain-containing protein, partial [Hyphomonadaceae bacterium]
MFTKQNGFATIAFGALVAAAGPALFQPAYAQDAGQSDEIVVTGSHIRGTPEDAALPVDVFRREELAAVGNPTLLELTRNLPASQGINGESNAYGSGRLEGLGNINLRGLGPGRTLVLINGQRQAPAGFSVVEFGQQQFVDTNSIPMAAIGRVEVLKDGAAATYGSDAVAGVVNFITRSNFEGFEIAASAQDVGGEAFSDDFYNYDASATYGWQGDRSSWVTTVGYFQREQIPYTEIDWILRSFADSQSGTPGITGGLWSSTTNPGAFTSVTAPYLPGGQPGYSSIGLYPTAVPTTTGGTRVNDPGCGDYVGGPGGEWGPVEIAGGACRFNSVAFSNLAEDEERMQLFSEFNHDFENGMRLHLEALFAHSEAGYTTAASFPPPVQSLQYVPLDNPALQALIATNPGVYGPLFANGAVFNGRIFGASGNFNGDAYIRGDRQYETSRLAGNVTGTFDSGILSGVNYDFRLAWSRSEAANTTDDLLTDRVRLGLLGLGGPNCDPETGTPGVGNCYWLAPYSDFQLTHILGGTTNPNYVDPGANTNTAALGDWLVGQTGFTATTGLTVGEAIFSGDTGIAMPGGSISWAAGAQVRAESYQVDPYDLSNIALNPCNTLGDIACGTSAGPFQFLAGWRPLTTSRSVYAVFGEISAPITDSLNMQIAARYEQYGGETGSTFDPKIQLRWQAADFLALRASAQTTFRAPTLNQLEETSTDMQPLIFPTFIPFDLVGNRNLTPETAFNYNLGAIFDFDNIGGSNLSFNATIDYWNFNLQDPIQREGVATIATPAAAAGCAPATAFYDRLTFQPGFTSGCLNVARVQLNLINGPEVNTDGFDVSTTLTIDDVVGGTLSLGLDGSIIRSYDVGAYVGDGYSLPSTSPLGFLNKNTGYRPLPEWKANALVRYTNGPHSVSVSGHYITDYEDVRVPTSNPEARSIDSVMTWDATYGVELPGDMNVAGGVFNIADV